MTLEQRLSALATAIGVDVKTLNGILGGGTAAVATAAGLTGDKTVVQALTAIYTLANNNANVLVNLINDAAIEGNVTQVFSADKVLSLVAATKADILGGIAPSTLDTIKELADYITNSGVVGGIVEQLAGKVDVNNVQLFTSMQQAQGRSNIGAASAVDLSMLTAAIGNPDVDLVSLYTAAKTPA